MDEECSVRRREEKIKSLSDVFSLLKQKQTNMWNFASTCPPVNAFSLKLADQ